MRTRTPEQIIGRDAVIQLIFEGYEIRKIEEPTQKLWYDDQHTVKHDIWPAAHTRPLKDT